MFRADLLLITRRINCV